VDHIYITENDVTVPQAMQDTLRPFVEDGFLRLEAWGDSEPAQMKIYDNCFKNIKDKYEWVALFNVKLAPIDLILPACLLHLSERASDDTVNDMHGLLSFLSVQYRAWYSGYSGCYGRPYWIHPHTG
jgi:hypothetical protein